MMGLTSTGYGFIEFEDKRDAEDAIRDLDGLQFFNPQNTLYNLFTNRKQPARSSHSGGVGTWWQEWYDRF